MKILVASDIHGSSFYTKKLLSIIQTTNPEKVILLGDIYYHGPRNKFPKKYAPMKVAESLNTLTNKLVCIKGNCDSEVDQMISEFKFVDSFEMNILGKKFLFKHGHKLNFDNLPSFDVVFSGHTHINGIKTINNTICVNPGSVSLPKEKTANSYAIIDEELIKIYSFKGEILHQIKFSS